MKGRAVITSSENQQFMSRKGTAVKLNSFVLAIFFALIQGVFPQEANSPGAKAQWKLVWSDEFNGPAIDKSVWTSEIGLSRTKEPQ